jgi:hypothetical protein
MRDPTLGETEVLAPGIAVVELEYPGIGPEATPLATTAHVKDCPELSALPVFDDVIPVACELARRMPEPVTVGAEQIALRCFDP